MNKKILKASGLIAIVWGLINIFVFIGMHFISSYIYLLDNIYCYIVMLLITIGSFISVFGGIIFLHYKELSDEVIKEKEKYIFYWAIIFLISSPISGILALISYFMMSCEREFKVDKDYIDEIRVLDELRKQGLISDKEFELKKKKLLDF